MARLPYPYLRASRQGVIRLTLDVNEVATFRSLTCHSSSAFFTWLFLAASSSLYNQAPPPLSILQFRDPSSTLFGNYEHRTTHQSFAVDPDFLVQFHTMSVSRTPSACWDMENLIHQCLTCRSSSSTPSSAPLVGMISSHNMGHRHNLPLNPAYRKWRLKSM